MSAYAPLVRLLAAEGGHEVFQTPHSWLPEWYEIAFGGLASVLVIGALFKFAIPALKKGLVTRSEKIQAALDGSAGALTDAKAAATQIRANKGDLQAERSRILADADKTAERVRSEGTARIAAEIAEAHAKADADIAAAQSRAQAELQADVAAIAAAATDQVVHGSLDGGTQQRLIEDFISKVGASR